MPIMLIVAGVALLACVVFVLFLIKRSPEGYQDQQEFRIGSGSPTPAASPGKQTRAPASKSGDSNSPAPNT